MPVTRAKESEGMYLEPVASQLHKHNFNNLKEVTINIFIGKKKEKSD